MKKMTTEQKLKVMDFMVKSQRFTEEIKRKKEAGVISPIDHAKGLIWKLKARQITRQLIVEETYFEGEAE